MSNSWLVPIRKADKGVRPGFGGDFWDDYWKGFQDARSYATKVTSLKGKTSRLLRANTASENTRLYAEIQLDETAESKSNKPQELWRETSLEVVCSKSPTEFTVSGYRRNFQKLETILGSSSFAAAKAGGSRKERNLYREAFAINSLEDANAVIAGRLSRRLSQWISEAERTDFECLIEVYSDQNLSDYESLFLKLSHEEYLNDRVWKMDEEFFLSNMTFRALLNKSQIEKILTDSKFNFISKIKHSPKMVAQRCVPTLDTTGLVVGEKLTGEIIGVIDSGINHPLLNPLVAHTYNAVKHHPIDNNHGTFVASRVMFGHDLFSATSGGTVNPLGKIMDIRVLCKKDPLSDESQVEDMDELKKAIATAVNRHQDVCIYNLSITETEEIDESDIDDFTEFIDQIARKHDVVIVCSAGNQSLYKSEDYGDVFSNPANTAKIASPGDALNALTVGAIVSSASEDTHCPTIGHPSPFTRKGGIRGDWKKPEFVSFGGNVKKDPSGVYGNAFMQASSNVHGVEGLNTGGYHKDIGTSFSTPLITRQCALLLHYIKRSNLGTFLNLEGNRLNLIKTLLTHSTAKVLQAKIKNVDVKKAYGFGIPDYEKSITDDDNSVSVIYCDQIQDDNKKHRLKIKLPEYLLGKPVKFTVTVSYDPPVDKNFPDEYKMISLVSNLRLEIPTMDEEGNLGKPDYKSLCQKPTWDKYKNSKYNTTHFSTTVRSLNSQSLELLLQMALSDKFESKHVGDSENIIQPYAAAITITDLSSEGRLRAEMLLTQQFQEVIETSVQVGT